MPSARDAVNGFERLVTRSLAIVAVAVAAGATHSWMHGPLNPSSDTPSNAQTQPVETTQGNADTDTALPNDDSNPGDVTTIDPATVPPDVTELPEGHITTAQAYAYFGTADFIDARPADEFAEGHITGALNLSLAMMQDPARMQEVMAWLDRSRPIVVYCRGGLCTEAKDVGRLLAAGYDHIFIYADGFPAWQAAGYMTETGPGQ